MAMYSDFKQRPRDHPVLIAEPAVGWDPAVKKVLEELMFKVISVTLFIFLNLRKIIF